MYPSYKVLVTIQCLMAHCHNRDRFQRADRGMKVKISSNVVNLGKFIVLCYYYTERLVTKLLEELVCKLGNT